MKALLIYNPVSGKGNSAKRIELIKDYFENESWQLDIHASKGTEDLIEIAFQKASSYEVFLVSGGDGTISNVVNGMMKSDIRPRMLVLPTGTANDFSNILGIQKNKIIETLDLLKTTQYAKTDIYKANDKYFIYAAAAGKFTDVSYDIKRRTVKRYGHFAYMLKAASEIFSRAKFDVEIILKDGTTYQKRSFLIFILAGKRVAGFNFKEIGPSVKLNDGKFEMLIFKRSHYLSWLKCFFFYFRKGKVTKKDLRLTVDEVTLNIKSKQRWNLDGEYGFDGQIHISVIPEAIEVYASEKSIKEYY